MLTASQLYLYLQLGYLSGSAYISVILRPRDAPRSGPPFKAPGSPQSGKVEIDRREAEVREAAGS